MSGIEYNETKDLFDDSSFIEVSKVIENNEVPTVNFSEELFEILKEDDRSNNKKITKSQEEEVLSNNISLPRLELVNSNMSELGELSFDQHERNLFVDGIPNYANQITTTSDNVETNECFDAQSFLSYLQPTFHYQQEYEGTNIASPNVSEYIDLTADEEDLNYQSLPTKLQSNQSGKYKEHRILDSNVVNSKTSTIICSESFPHEAQNNNLNDFQNSFMDQIYSRNEAFIPSSQCSYSYKNDYFALSRLQQACTSSRINNQEITNNLSRFSTPIISLVGQELWLKFHEIGTEMIITKAGRRMFPSLKVKVENLDATTKYVLAVEVLPVDNLRYRYVYSSSQWMASGNVENILPQRIYIHPESPACGELWMRQAISFDKMKLTNNECNNKGHIILHSMRKYQPRIHVIKFKPNLLEKLLVTQQVGPDVDDVTTFIFQETAFTTVTAYQNQQITKLKIERNPFAKGFRDTQKQPQDDDRKETPSSNFWI